MIERCQSPNLWTRLSHDWLGMAPCKLERDAVQDLWAVCAICGAKRVYMPPIELPSQQRES
jgi:hypothetical protein